jgi:hypothetical protein
MKLLNPRTIQSNLTSERKKDIDQGVVLARKVDTLRETLSQEEFKLRIFEEVTKKEVLESINLKIKERDALEEENAGLRNIREALIADKEWLRVNEKSNKIKIAIEELKTSTIKVEKDKEKVREQTEKIEIEKGRQRNREVEIHRREEEALRTLSEASKCLSDAQNEEKRITTHSVQKQAELNTKEAVLQSTVNDIARRERDLNDKEKLLLAKERQVNDKYATLTRTLERLNSN